MVWQPEAYRWVPCTKQLPDARHKYRGTQTLERRRRNVQLKLSDTQKRPERNELTTNQTLKVTALLPATPPICHASQLSSVFTPGARAKATSRRGNEVLTRRSAGIRLSQYTNMIMEASPLDLTDTWYANKNLRLVVTSSFPVQKCRIAMIFFFPSSLSIICGTTVRLNDMREGNGFTHFLSISHTSLRRVSLKMPRKN